MADRAKPRGKPDEETPWCWQNKPALRLIRTRLDGTEEISSALSTYVALTEIASDKGGASTFETTHAWIGMFAGLSAPTVKRRLPILVEIGVIAIAEKRPGIRGPDTYTLLSLAHNELTLGHSEPALGQHGNGAARPPSEENQKKDSEETERKKIGAEAPRTGAPTLRQWYDYAEKHFRHWPEIDVIAAFNYYEANGWLHSKGKRVTDWRKACRTCFARWSEENAPSTTRDGTNPHQRKAPTTEEHAKGW